MSTILSTTITTYIIRETILCIYLEPSILQPTNNKLNN